MHCWESTYPVYNNTPSQTPAGNPKVYVDPVDTTHFVIGTAGAMIFEKWVQPEPVWSAFRAQHYGYVNLVVYNATHLEATFLVERTHDVLDTVWIQRSKSPA